MGEHLEAPTLALEVATLRERLAYCGRRLKAERDALDARAREAEARATVANAALARERAERERVRKVLESVLRCVAPRCQHCVNAIRDVLRGAAPTPPEEER